MTSLKAVSITAKYSAGGCDDSSSESEFSDSSDSFLEADYSNSVPVTDSSDDECGDELRATSYKAILPLCISCLTVKAPEDPFTRTTL